MNKFGKYMIMLFVSAMMTACASHRGLDADVRTAHAIGESDVVSTEGMGEEEGGFGGHVSSAVLLAKRTYHFAFDSDRLSASDKVAALAQAKYLVKHPSAKILLQGNTDERGSHAYNIALGWRRAKAVKRFLLSHGVNPIQIQVVSYGMEHPVALGHTEADHRANRRVDLAYEG